MVPAVTSSDESSRGGASSHRRIKDIEDQYRELVKRNMEYEILIRRQVMNEWQQQSQYAPRADYDVRPHQKILDEEARLQEIIQI